MEVLFFAISLIFCFFILYTLSKNDFVLLRKNKTIHNMFDTFILSLIGFFILGRLLYIFGGLHISLYSPIAVLHVLRYPGILFMGGVVGFFIVTILRFKRRKITLHILDIYSLSLYPLFLLAFFTSSFQGNFLYFNFFILILSLLFFCFGIYSHRNIVLKDGNVSLLFLCLISVFTIINEFSEGNRVIFSFSIAQIIAIVLFLLGSIGLLTYESFLFGKRK